jgi:hypothetical protein
MAPEVEPFHDGVNRIVAVLRARIGHPEFVTLTQVSSVAGASSEPSVIVYDPTTPSHRSKGTPLLVMALCADSATWPAIQVAFEQEGFDAVTPEPDHGRVFYRSRKRAMLIVAANPGVASSVEQTGKPLLTEII